MIENRLMGSTIFLKSKLKKASFRTLLNKQNENEKITYYYEFVWLSWSIWTNLCIA